MAQQPADDAAAFEDYFPAMVEKLGADGFVEELCKGFKLLMDKERKAITVDSLRKNSAILGLPDLEEEEVKSMVAEGDLDGDGCLSEMEFCVLMCRLSPHLMSQARSFVAIGL